MQTAIVNLCSQYGECQIASCITPKTNCNDINNKRSYVRKKEICCKNC